MKEADSQRCDIVNKDEMKEADSQRCDIVNKASALTVRVMQTVKTS